VGNEGQLFVLAQFLSAVLFAVVLCYGS